MLVYIYIYIYQSYQSIWHISYKYISRTHAHALQVHAHYFEDGNVQLQTSKQISPVSLSFSSEADLAAKVVALIQSSESNVQAGLEDMYANMAEETFKAMRRVMPVKRTKMDWNINAVRMNKQVRK